MQKWEYLAVASRNYLSDAQLNQYGEQGWELLSWYEARVNNPQDFGGSTLALHFVFKRPK